MNRFSFNINKLEEFFNSLNDEKYRLEFLKLKSRNNLTWDNIRNNLSNMNLYFDYDEWLVDLIQPWIEYINKHNEMNLKKSDVISFNFFASLKNGLDFLEKEEDVYKNVEVREGIFELFETLYENNLLKNVSIVTATHPRTYLSKMNHFEEKIVKPLNKIFLKKYNTKFPMSFENNFITTKQKWKLNFNNSVLVDDAIHNAEDVVINNPYSYVMVVDHNHNKNLKTGNRILRLNKIEDFFKILLLISLKSYDRRHDIKKAYLIEESYKNSNS